MSSARPRLRRVRWGQFQALTIKNWLTLRRNWLANLLRCLLVPVAYYVFLVYTQDFLASSQDLGLGTPRPIRSLTESLGQNSKILYWVDNSNATNPSAQDLIDTLVAPLDASLKARVQRMDDIADVSFRCPQSYNGYSTCFGAIVFNHIRLSPTGSVQVNYTLRFDPGLKRVRTKTGSSDVQLYILPVQLALDQAILQRSGASSDEARRSLAPQELQFSHQTNGERHDSTRVSFLRGTNQVIVLAFFVGFLGLPYHLASDFSFERESGMTDLLTSLGCNQVARMCSWIAGPPLAYVPAYLLMGMMVKIKLWTRTSAAVPLLGFLLEGLALATFTLFLTSFFRHSTRSAIVITIINIVLAILALISFSPDNIAQGPMVFLAFLFPPMNIIYFFISVDLWEMSYHAAKVTQRPPADHQWWPVAAPPLAIMLVTIASMMMYFFLAMLVERIRFYPDNVLHWLWPWRRSAGEADGDWDPNVAITLTHVRKQFGKRADSVAIEDCTLSVTRPGITVLLGRNGSGKTTLVKMVAGLTSPTSGEVRCLGQRPSQLPPGTIGFCPQQNFFWSDLTVIEHAWLFNWLKGGSPPSFVEAAAVITPFSKWQPSGDSEALLRACGLGQKMASLPNELSGGQQRKLSLATSLSGSSPLVVVDEACTGLDPVSRRSLWRILLAERHRRTILYTTHFLDADYIADEVMILGPPGRLLAHGSPVQLRSALGDGVHVHASLALDDGTDMKEQVWQKIIAIWPAATDAALEDTAIALTVPANQQETVVLLLDALEEEKKAGRVQEYNGSGATMEEVFLKLSGDSDMPEDDLASDGPDNKDTIEDKRDSVPAEAPKQEAEPDKKGSAAAAPGDDTLQLSDGQSVGTLSLTLAQILKRCQLARFSWPGSLLAIIISIAGSAAVLCFTRDRNASCTRGFAEYQDVYSLSTVPQVAAVYPESLAPELNAAYSPSRFVGVPLSNWSATYTSGGTWSQVPVGAVSLGSPRMFAWLGDQRSGVAGVELLSVMNNQLMAQSSIQRNASAPSVQALFQPMASMAFGDALGDALKWAIIFALVQSVWPAFAALVPSTERQSGSQELLLTNGQRPLPLWLGHFLTEVPVVVLATVPVAIIYGAAGNGHFFDIAYLWLVLFFNGLACTAHALWVARITPGPLAAFAVAAIWNIVALLIMIATILASATFVVSEDMLGMLRTIWWTEGILAPGTSVLWAAHLSGNLFNLLCDGHGGFASASPGNINYFGGPILYAIIWLCIALSIPILLDYDVFHLPSRRRALACSDPEKARAPHPTVADEEARVNEKDNQDVVRVLGASVAYGSNIAVDDVSLGVPQGDTLALLGPNAAGKTTLHKLIRAEVHPTVGRVEVQGMDVTHHRATVRRTISSVPQNDGLDMSLSVRAHLTTYARVRGVPRDDQDRNVRTVMAYCDLTRFAHRAAGKLSGGAKRRLMLAIALLGNPTLFMLDELSSGVDALTKRYLWRTLRRISQTRTVVMTTHSIEEVDALSTRLAIMRGHLLLVGSINQVRQAFPWVEIQFAVDRHWTPPASSPSDGSLTPDVKTLPFTFPGGLTHVPMSASTGTNLLLAPKPASNTRSKDDIGLSKDGIASSNEDKTSLKQGIEFASASGGDGAGQADHGGRAHAQQEFIWSHVILPFFPRARRSDETTLRYEVPLSSIAAPPVQTANPSDGQDEHPEHDGHSTTTSTSIADVYRTLHRGAPQLGQAGITDYHVQPISLEAIFLRIVQEAQADPDMPTNTC